MNWENCDSISEGKETANSEDHSKSVFVQDISAQNEQKNYYQLQKLKDPNKDENRQAYISSSSRLGDFISNKIKEEDIQNLLVDDFEAFLFNFAGINPVLHVSNPTEFLSFYKNTRVIKRDIKEVNVDLDSTIPTVFQICYCEILNVKENKIVPQFSFEIFSFRNDKISKYRASFGYSSSFNEHYHPFSPSKKDIMFAKVKELNYAWAGQPDLNKIASLFNESTEYKIWRWQDQKPFLLHKDDFVKSFRNLADKYTINSVVPYEVYSEGQYIMSNYVFCLDGKHDLLVGKKFMWFSTCIYKFDKDVNIVKISQQGELHSADKTVIPFNSYSKQVIRQKVIDTNELAGNNLDVSVIDTSEVNFSFEISLFHSLHTDKIDHVKGFSDYDKLSAALKMKSRDIEWEKIVDLYIDIHDPSYDVAISIECGKAGVNQDSNRYSGTELNLYIVKKVYLENGKVAKATIFILEVPESIPSPYDDSSFTAANIKYKEKFIK